MKRKITLLLITLAAVFLLSACGSFTCDICNQKKSGQKYEYELFGQKMTICNDCYNDIQKIKDGLGDITDILK